MRTLQELLSELEANDATEIEIELAVGHTVNISGIAPSQPAHPFGARRGGIELGITKEEAFLLRQHGAKSDPPHLQGAGPD